MLFMANCPNILISDSLTATASKDKRSSWSQHQTVSDWNMWETDKLTVREIVARFNIEKILKRMTYWNLSRK
jgi:hypothetical protein